MKDKSTNEQPIIDKNGIGGTQPAANGAAVPQADPGKTLGIVSLVLALIGLILGVFTAIPGFIVGLVGFLKSKKVGITNGLAIAGMALSVIITIVGFWLLATVLNSDEFQEALEEASQQVEMQEAQAQ